MCVAHINNIISYSAAPSTLTPVELISLEFFLVLVSCLHQGQKVKLQF